jgi:WD40 repeat protein
VAYVAKSGEQSIVVVDGVEEKTFKGDVVSVRFSPDSKHLLYRVIEPTDGGAKHCFYVMDGMEQKKYAYEPEYMSLYDWFIPSTQISLFSPDSKHVAYWGKTDDKYVLVVDGMERPVFTKRPLPLPIFSPDSQHMACVAISGDKECVVIDGKEMKQFNGVSQLIFGPDSSHIAYVVQIDNNAVVVVDGNAQKEYAAAVSKDKDATRTLALPYVSVWGLCFSPDSKHLAYIVASGDKKLVIVDGTEAVVCEGDDEILCGRIVFDSPTLCHALVKRGEDVFLVEILITE